MDNPDRFRYISKKAYLKVLEDLNIDQTEEGGFDTFDENDLIDRAVGDLESDLVKRFVVPLVALSGGPYDSSPFYDKQKILNAIKSKIRQLIGDDKVKNIVIDSSERYIDLKKSSYKSDIKTLLDPERIYGFRLQTFADDGALNPVQQIGVARPDNRTDFNDLEDFEDC